MLFVLALQSGVQGLSAVAAGSVVAWAGAQGEHARGGVCGAGAQGRARRLARRAGVQERASVLACVFLG